MANDNLTELFADDFTGYPLCERIERDGRRFLDQPESFFNVVLKTGDAEWRDYTLELDVAVAWWKCMGPSMCPFPHRRQPRHAA